VESGKADRSYGIEVARLAGLPLEVIERARAVLQTHERKETAVTEELSAPAEPPPLQVSIFQGGSGGVLEELQNLNLDEMKPIEALSLLHEWKTKLKGAA